MLRRSEAERVFSGKCLSVKVFHASERFVHDKEGGSIHLELLEEKGANTRQGGDLKNMS